MTGPGPVLPGDRRLRGRNAAGACALSTGVCRCALQWLARQSKDDMMRQGISPMSKTFSFYLKNREDAVEVDGDKLDDDGAKVAVTDGNAQVAVFVWAELQGYTVED